jgi:hypothetical protein
MSEENGWVALPKPAPRTLPAGTKLESEANIWTLETEHRAAPLCYHGTHTDKDGERFENSVLLIRAVQRVQLPAGYQFLGGQATQVTTVADLGDTPEHLRPLLKAVRAVRPGAVISEGDDWKATVWFANETGMHGWNFDDDFDRREFFDRKNNHGWGCDCHDKERLKRAIEQGRCYPTEDARRIGREEFGMSFGEDEEEDLGECANCGEPFKRFAVTVLKNGAHYCTTACSLRQPESPDDLNAAIHASFKTGTEWIPRPQPTRALTSPILAPSCACGATSNLRQIGVKFDDAFQAYGEFRCGPCEQSRRRADLQAAKVEQARADLDRKVPAKWLEAPAMWPEQFSGSSWEE